MQDHALQCVEQKILGFEVWACERLCTYEIIETSQKIVHITQVEISKLTEELWNLAHMNGRGVGTNPAH